ncbi:MAG: FAD-dependent oxidoreductase [Clostridiales bacterium]|nr:FAD-dependent oxidoreductase [Clostridiales bacterium]
MKRFFGMFMALLLLFTQAACAEGMTAGTYTTAAKGFHGDIQLEVTVTANEITAINVASHSETEGIGEAALPLLVDAVLESQSIGIDDIAGATVTSTAFKAAVTAALEQAGADMEKMAAPVAASEEKQEVALSTDIVVVGAGAAGLTAALTAVQEGKSVILLEKTPFIGGASATAGAGTIATGSAWQKEDGYEDSPEKLVEDMMANGHGKNDRATVELFSRIIGPSFDWLVDEKGAAVPYKRTGKPVRNYSGEGRGAGVCKSLNDSFLAAGGTLMTATPATELLVDGGRVVGVKAESSDKAYTIQAKAVILASGGFGANKDLLPPDNYDDYVYAGHAGAQGDAIKMTEKLDAELINMQYVNMQPHSMRFPDGNGRGIGGGPGYQYDGSFMVNQDGVRFLNEVGKAWDNTQALKKNERQYIIMDQTSFDALNEANSSMYTAGDVELWISDDYSGDPVYKKGESLEALAEKLNVPAGALRASVEEFNKAYASGEADSFGRTLNAPISEEGPYYGLQIFVRYYATLGGLHINDEMQVLTKAQEPIEGLYAAGECVGGLEGDVYMSATLFGWAVASGHTAGLMAVDSVTE